MPDLRVAHPFDKVTFNICIKSQDAQSASNPKPISQTILETDKLAMKATLLADGTPVPHIAFGSGTALLRQECTSNILTALRAGFTHIDTAQRYGNEDSVGRAIKEFLATQTGVTRSDLFVTTKFRTLEDGQSVEDSLRGSLEKLQLEYVDSFLIHAPIGWEKQPDGIKGLWAEMVAVKAKGLANTIGVSNFGKRHLQELLSTGLEPPAVNQVRRARCRFRFVSTLSSNAAFADRIPPLRCREARAPARLQQSAWNCHVVLLWHDPHCPLPPRYDRLSSRSRA